MKLVLLIITQLAATLAMANGPTVSCSTSQTSETGNPDFVSNINIEISGRLLCDNPLPQASMSYEQAKSLVENNSCVTEVISEGRHESFVKGFERIVATHDVIAGSRDTLTIEPAQRCVAKDCKGSYGGCSCVKSVPAPELGFIIRGSGLFLQTNKTEILDERVFERTSVSMTDVEILAGTESKTIDGVVIYNGAPQRTKYQAINWDLGEETKNLSYDIRKLNFNENECSLN